MLTKFIPVSCIKDNADKTVLWREFKPLNFCKAYRDHCLEWLHSSENHEDSQVFTRKTCHKFLSNNILKLWIYSWMKSKLWLSHKPNMIRFWLSMLVSVYYEITEGGRGRKLKYSKLLSICKYLENYVNKKYQDCCIWLKYKVWAKILIVFIINLETNQNLYHYLLTDCSLRLVWKIRPKDHINSWSLYSILWNTLYIHVLMNAIHKFHIDFLTGHTEDIIQLSGIPIVSILSIKM